MGRTAKSRIPGIANLYVLAGFVLGLFWLIYSVFFASAASAASTATGASVRIVPLECIIEEVNNGVTETYFLGPMECENKLNPPVNVPGNEPGGSATRELMTGNQAGQLFFGGPVANAFEEQKQTPAQQADIEFTPRFQLPKTAFGLITSLVILLIFILNIILFITGSSLRQILAQILRLLRQAI
jgi:hypothetical protein